MDWVKLATNYYNDPAIMRAGEAAEVLFTRALAYAGDQETDGVILAIVLPRFGLNNATRRAAALVREGLWEVIPDGWRFVSWDKHQTSADQIAGKRQSGRERQARHRANRRRDAVRNAVTNTVSDAEVTLREVEEEVDAAAAAARLDPEVPPVGLPAAVYILRSKLDARRLTVRWDKLTRDQLTTIEHLIALHGDAPLVEAAGRTYRPDSPPVFAQAWLGTWTALPVPGQRLAAVPDPPCPAPGHSGTTRSCAQCAAERLAGDRA